MRNRWVLRVLVGAFTRWEGGFVRGGEGLAHCGYGIGVWGRTLVLSIRN